MWCIGVVCKEHRLHNIFVNAHRSRRDFSQHQNRLKTKLKFTIIYYTLKDDNYQQLNFLAASSHFHSIPLYKILFFNVLKGCGGSNIFPIPLSENLLTNHMNCSNGRLAKMNIYVFKLSSREIEIDIDGSD